MVVLWFDSTGENNALLQKNTIINQDPEWHEGSNRACYD